jgi:SRSO17 transposase
MDSVSGLTEYTEDADGSLYPTSRDSHTDTDEIRRRKKPKANEELWSHTREARDGEHVRNKHYQQIYYCDYCSSYDGSSNAGR